MADTNALIKELTETLRESQDHHDYCGYGDSWERECALASGLVDRIEAVAKKGESYLAENLQKGEV